jgi:prefoldin alpha subunit
MWFKFKMNEELNKKFRIFEQKIMQIQQQLASIEKAIADMSLIESGLEKLIGKKNEEILAPVGNGIFLQTKLLSEELFVEIAEKKLIKKSIPETRELIRSQILKLKKSQEILETELDKINEDLTKTMQEYQK